MRDRPTIDSGGYMPEINSDFSFKDATAMNYLTQQILKRQHDQIFMALLSILGLMGACLLLVSLPRIIRNIGTIYPYTLHGILVLSPVVAFFDWYEGSAYELVWWKFFEILLVVGIGWVIYWIAKVANVEIRNLKGSMNERAERRRNIRVKVEREHEEERKKEEKEKMNRERFEQEKVERMVERELRGRRVYWNRSVDY